MAYNKTVWQTGDTITAEKLNNIENGIAGTVLVVNYSEDPNIPNKFVFDKTWQEIYDVFSAGGLVTVGYSFNDGGYEGVNRNPVVEVYSGEGTYAVGYRENRISYANTDSADGYPHFTSGGDS